MNTQIQSVPINGTNLLVKEYQGNRVVTFNDIDMVHKRPDGTARKRFSDNRKRFNEEEDFFIVKPEDLEKSRMSEKRTTGINNVNFRGTTFITESGYLMLVKSFTDDLAWDVQRKLVKSYFNKEEFVPSQYNNNSNDIVQITCLLSEMIKLQKEEREVCMNAMKSFVDNMNNTIQNFTYILMGQQHQLTPEDMYPKSNTISEGQEFKNQIYRLCDNIVKNSDFDKSQLVLSHAYRLINRKYGICWEQEIKDYKELHNMDRKPSLINVIADSNDDKYLKSILLSILKDMDIEYQKKHDYSKDTKLLRDNSTIIWEDIQNKIQSLAKLSNDNSPYAAVTYNKIYKLMDGDINWTYYKSQYKKKNNITARKAIVSKKDMIRCNGKLQELFVNALDRKIQEVDSNGTSNN